METSRLMKMAGYIVLGTFAVFNVITLIFMDRMAPEFGPEIAGPHSIYASKGFFIAYHVWGIALAGLCIYTMWKEIRVLFMISLLLLLILMFYPYFSMNPSDQAKPKKELPADSIPGQTP